MNGARAQVPPSVELRESTCKGLVLVIELTLSVLVPVLEIVSDCDCMNTPDLAGIRLIAVGATVKAGKATATPLPDRLIDPGPVPLLLTLRLALRAPAALGWKATPTVQEAPCASAALLVQVELVIVKSAALAPPF